MKNVALIAACCLVSMLTAFGQANPSAGTQPGTPASANPEAETYEIVSIKPHKPGDDPGSMSSPPNGFEWRNVVLDSLVHAAYGIVMEDQVVGLPDWARSDRYDIVAIADAATIDRWKKLTIEQRAAEEEPMMRAILANRCQFRAHQVTKELPVYDLVIAKEGLKMKEASPHEDSMEYMNGERMTVRAMPIYTLIYGLTNGLGRLIVDKTGLGNRKFDFELQWSDRPAVDDADAAPSLFTALHEQLGLRLVSSKAPVQVLVIDHMERPTPN